MTDPNFPLVGPVSYRVAMRMPETVRLFLVERERAMEAARAKAKAAQEDQKAALAECAAREKAEPELARLLGGRSVAVFTTGSPFKVLVVWQDITDTISVETVEVSSLEGEPGEKRESQPIKFADPVDPRASGVS